MKPVQEQFLADCAAWGISVDAEIIEKLEEYASLLVEHNRKMNLTAITEESAIWKLHFLDSLAPLRSGAIRTTDTGRLIDIGAGAGFPGMVLKLFLPSWHITLLDAQEKRIRFLEEVKKRLLSGAAQMTLDAMHARAEDLARNETCRAAYDICTARAVSRLRVLAEYGIPFLKTGGIFAVYKSADTDAEIAEAQTALQILGGSVEKTEMYLLPQSDIARRMVYIKKQTKTDARYPRRAGVPEKKPL